MGQGDFLTPVIERLLTAYDRVPAKARRSVLDNLGACLTAVELHQDSYSRSWLMVSQALRELGISKGNAKALCRAWLRQGDFLLQPLEPVYTHAIGNPPYVRQELIPDVLMAEYRHRFSTIYDHADIYIPFIERSLSLLAPGGKLGFICADRWMKNSYGGPLRRLVFDKFHLQHFVDMVDTPAFQSDVIAYPAIVVIGREKRRGTRLAFRPAIDSDSLKTLARAMLAPILDEAGEVTEVTNVARGSEPWMLEAPEQLALVRRLEAAHPTLGKLIARWASASPRAPTRSLSAPMMSSMSSRTASCHWPVADCPVRGRAVREADNGLPQLNQLKSNFNRLQTRPRRAMSSGCAAVPRSRACRSARPASVGYCRL